MKASFRSVITVFPLAEIRRAFSMTGRFALPDEVKGRYPAGPNAGWESKAQVRPSTRPGSKRSYQITRPADGGAVANDQQLPAFKKTMLEFESRCWQLGMKLLSCFALKLGFAGRFHHRSRSGSLRPAKHIAYAATTYAQRAGAAEGCGAPAPIRILTA